MLLAKYIVEEALEDEGFDVETMTDEEMFSKFKGLEDFADYKGLNATGIADECVFQLNEVSFKILKDEDEFQLWWIPIGSDYAFDQPNEIREIDPLYYLTCGNMESSWVFKMENLTMVKDFLDGLKAPYTEGSL